MTPVNESFTGVSQKLLQMAREQMKRHWDVLLVRAGKLKPQEDTFSHNQNDYTAQSQ